MKFNHEHYVPCLRWKQGEYQAVLRLSRSATRLLTPVIEAAEIGFDFETLREKKTVDDHLAPFAKRVRTKWGVKPCFVDLKLLDSSSRMADGTHPADFVFGELRAEECHAVPVTGPERDSQYQRAVRGALKSDGHGLCLRVGIELASRPEIKDEIGALLKSMRTNPNECDLILDLGSPNFSPLKGFSKLVQAVISRIPYLRRWRTFTLLGSSFPQSMAEIKSSPEIVERSEWLLYKRVIAGLRANGTRIPTFGDYAINHPEVLHVDMRKVKPSASIRYTVDDAWFVVKGPNVRQNGFRQYRRHCKTVMESTGYCGAAFSAGDSYIEGCADGTEKTGNLTTWRWVGTNHHLEKVIRDVASFCDFSSSP